ncbi:hypothetical protein PAECIP111893_01120 [Paenibacillus plantiphilus]|uniref:Uncharacterized protein n=1 Tax=Paenibacillus plantiphilus TaxID=2905650 RepID=A0ABN8G8I2_9BACL|nr:hypothetical protein PAECIP111893_01120 [Paenibacillus plantiphilus]
MANLYEKSHIIRHFAVISAIVYEKSYRIKAPVHAAQLPAVGKAMRASSQPQTCRWLIRVCSGYAAGTQRVCSGYAAGMQRVRSKYPAGTQQVPSGYAASTQRVRSKYPAGTQQVPSGYAASTQRAHR